MRADANATRTSHSTRATIRHYKRQQKNGEEEEERKKERKGRNKRRKNKKSTSMSKIFKKTTLLPALTGRSFCKGSGKETETRVEKMQQKSTLQNIMLSDFETACCPGGSPAVPSFSGEAATSSQVPGPLPDGLPTIRLHLWKRRPVPEQCSTFRRQLRHQPAVTVAGAWRGRVVGQGKMGC